MRCRSNENQRALNRVFHSHPALQARVYAVFLEMRELLEHYAPLWYSEHLHQKTEAVIREYCARAKSRSQKEKSLRRQEAA